MNTPSSASSASSGRTEVPGKVAVVTGGSRGIGYAIAAALVEHGARVVISGRDQKHLDLARERIGAAHEDAIHAVAADVTDAVQAAGAIDAAVERFGGLDVLVNNAGVGAFQNVADMSIERWRQVIGTNLDGVFYCSHAAIPHLKKRGGGWIINISSLAGKNWFAGGAAYCASKAGLNAFSEALMQEVRYDDIRVSYIMPGSVSTEFSGPSGGGSADWKIASEDIAEIVLDLIAFPARSLPSRIELRPSKPRK